MARPRKRKQKEEYEVIDESELENMTYESVLADLKELEEQDYYNNLDDDDDFF